VKKRSPCDAFVGGSSTSTGHFTGIFFYLPRFLTENYYSPGTASGAPGCIGLSQPALNGSP
jgi:hypothetical protein